MTWLLLTWKKGDLYIVLRIVNVISNKWPKSINCCPTTLGCCNWISRQDISKKITIVRLEQLRKMCLLFWLESYDLQTVNKTAIFSSNSNLICHVFINYFNSIWLSPTVKGSYELSITYPWTYRHTIHIPLIVYLIDLIHVSQYAL